jgi:hypothetical protein
MGGIQFFKSDRARDLSIFIHRTKMNLKPKNTTEETYDVRKSINRA